MPKVNILYCITKLELGGAQKQLLSLISLLDKDRFNVFLFTGREGLLVEETRSLSLAKVKYSYLLKRRIDPIFDLLSFSELYMFIKKNKIDIVHTHSSKAGILGRLAAHCAKVKLIIHTVHGWSFNDCQPKLVKTLYVWLERLTARLTHRLIVVADYDKQKGLGAGIGREAQYCKIRYGIDPDEFCAKAKDRGQIFGIDKDTLVVGTVSCLKPQKSPQDFIKLAAMVTKEFPNVKFILAGDGRLRRRSEALIKKLKLESKVILAGWRKDIHRVYQAMDVFVLTSLWEGLPVAALEAMASSVPVVATDTGGITEAVNNGYSGFLVLRRDMESMAAKVSLLLREASLRKGMGENACKETGKFLLTNMAKDTQGLYLALL